MLCNQYLTRVPDGHTMHDIGGLANLAVGGVTADGTRN